MITRLRYWMGRQSAASRGSVSLAAARASINTFMRVVRRRPLCSRCYASPQIISNSFFVFFSQAKRTFVTANAAVALQPVLFADTSDMVGPDNTLLQEQLIILRRLSLCSALLWDSKGDLGQHFAAVQTQAAGSDAVESGRLSPQSGGVTTHTSHCDVRFVSLRGKKASQSTRMRRLFTVSKFNW